MRDVIPSAGITHNWDLMPLIPETKAYRGWSDMVGQREVHEKVTRAHWSLWFGADTVQSRQFEDCPFGLRISRGKSSL